MKKLIYKNCELEEKYPYDVDRLVEVCKQKGYEVTRNDARLAWEDYSELY